MMIDASIDPIKISIVHLQDQNNKFELNKQIKETENTLSTEKGVDRDVANHALTGSWSRPPAGPGPSNFDEPRKIELHFHDNVYGMNDFDKQVEKSVNRLVPGGAF